MLRENRFATWQAAGGDTAFHIEHWNVNCVPSSSSQQIGSTKAHDISFKTDA